MRRAHLHPNSRLALGHHWKEKTHHVHAQFQQARRQLLGHLGFKNHDGHDRVVTRRNGKTGLAHGLAEVAGVVGQLVAQGGGAFQQIEHRDGSAHDHGRHGVGKKIGARTLAQQLNHLAAPAGKAARGAAQRLAQRAGDEVHVAPHAPVLGCAPARGAHKAGGVAFVHAQQRAVAVAQLAHDIELRHRAVHGKHAIGKHQRETRALGAGLCQATFQVGHVVVFVAVAFGLAQANAVNDGGMVELVADDRVLLAQQGLKESAVGVKRGGIKNGVFGA